jgi:hypothetical protein
VTPSSLVSGYKRFGGRCCLHLQGINVKVKGSVGLYWQIAWKEVCRIHRRGKSDRIQAEPIGMMNRKTAILRPQHFDQAGNVIVFYRLFPSHGLE